MSLAKEKDTIFKGLDYYPFGMQKPGRSFASGEYKYGFNDMLKDDELKGEGNSYTTEFRQYDPRLGRWLSVDPLFDLQPGWSSYKAMYNNPIFWTDPKGGTEEERKKALAQAKKYKEKNAGYEYGAKGAPGQPVDCSGLVSGCIVSAGLTNPVGQGTGTGVNQIMQASTKIQKVNDIEIGNAVVIDWNASGGNPHVGIISEVNRDADGNVTSYKFIHSSTSKGPTENKVTIGGSGYYDGKRITGWYKWDTPDSESDNNSDGSSWSFSAWWNSWSVPDLGITEWWDSWSFPNFDFSFDFGSSSSLSSYTVNTSGSNLNLRGGAGSGFDVIGSVTNGTTLTGTGNISDGWTEVTTSDGQTGWVSSDYIQGK